MSEPSPVRFGVFELDLRTRELRKHGVRLRLQDQPFEVLQALVERPGEIVVSREELQHRIWGDNTFVDFDQSLNRAVNKVRDALCDGAGTPRYIETLPRRGYRFIAPVEVESKHESKPLAPPDASPKSHARFARAISGLLALFGVGLWLAHDRSARGAPSSCPEASV
jgi:DNA-binding winged helix-turn-helix (wHTH) protein